jgi:two-component system sensor histidine kinase KdpD
VAVYQMSEERSVEVLFGGGSEIVRHPVSEAAARWAIEHDQLAGSGTDTLPNAVALFLPMIGSQKTVGALAVRLDSPDRWNDPEERRLLEACAGSLASAIERDAMSLAAAEARIDAQAEHVRSSLLGGISHDLRTPLAAIAGASSSILQAHTLDDATRRRLSEMISSEANRLTRLLENILRMSRLEFGGASADLQWNILEEIVGSAIVRSRAELGDRTVHVSIPAEPALIEVDGLLLEQLFVNLFENAARYTPPEARIEVEARVEGRRLSIRIADDGPGLPPGSEERIFEKFHRAHPTVDGSRGSGLGLAICRAIAKVHGGTITARYRAKGGAEFLLVLPLAKDPPRIAHEAGRVEGPERER